MEKNSYPGTPEAPFFLQSYGVTLLCKSKKWMNSASVCSFPENQKSKTQVLQGSYLPLYPQVLVFDPDRFCIFPLKAFILLCFLPDYHLVLLKETVIQPRALAEKDVFLRGKNTGQLLWRSFWAEIGRAHV